MASSSIWHRAAIFPDRAAGSALGEDEAVRGSGQADEVGRRRLADVPLVCPPLVVVEPEEEDGVVFKSLAAVDGHERDGVGGFNIGESLRPVPRAGHNVPQPLGQRADDEGDVVARVGRPHIAGEPAESHGADNAVDGLDDEGLTNDP